MIINPTLPPRKDYVEVEIDGVRQYKNINDFYLETPEEKYDARVVELIRAQYSADDEYKVLREYLAYGSTNPDAATAFNTYNTFVETCKAQAHIEIYGE
ncbi:MAG: hypothetical protein AB7C97_09570 [Oscillospiraceae bacterium]